MTYSHSKLETFDQCRLKYKYKYIDKIPVPIPTTIEAFLGSLIHETLHKLYQILELRVPSLRELLEFYQEIWNKNYSSDILIVKSNKTSEDYKKLGEKLIINYYFKNHPFNQAQTLALETEELIPLDYTINYHVRIDRLAQNQDIFEIHDYKTSNNLKTQQELDQDKQLAMYSLWVKSKFPQAQKIKLVWHFLSHNTNLESSRTESQLAFLKQQTLAKIHEIESAQEFSSSLGPLCKYCEYQTLCLDFKNSQDTLTQ